VSAANPGRQPHAWGEAAVAHLRQRWSDGAGTALIGAELGITKNAVVGKVRRLRLAPRASPLHAAGQPRPPARPRPVKPPRPPRPPKAVQAPPEPRPVPPPPPPPQPEPVVPRGCQYPRGSKPNWDWCGAPVVDGGPYCEPCRRRCWIVPPRRAAA
jgi:GcrA cell cycle regulator